MPAEIFLYLKIIPANQVLFVLNSLQYFNQKYFFFQEIFLQKLIWQKEIQLSFFDILTFIMAEILCLPESISLNAVLFFLLFYSVQFFSQNPFFSEVFLWKFVWQKEIKFYFCDIMKFISAKTFIHPEILNKVYLFYSSSYRGLADFT